MRPKSLLLIVIALGCGLVASIGISQVLNKPSERNDAPTETEQVYVAMVDINHGDPLSADMVRLEDWPKGRVPEGAIANLDDLLDRRPRTPLVAGEVILASKLIDPNSPYGASQSIPTGMRVSAVVVSTGDTPTGLVLPGDRVDVLCYFRASNDIPVATTKTILRNVTVFAVNEQTVREADRDNSVINAKTVALLLTPEQDRLLMLASELGKLRISLRRAGDENDDEADQVTVDDLLDRPAQDATFTARAPDPDPDDGDDFVGFLSSQDQTASDTRNAFRMDVMSSDGNVTSYEWDDEQNLPTPVSAATPVPPVSASPAGAASAIDTNLDFDPQDFDPDQSVDIGGQDDSEIE